MWGKIWQHWNVVTFYREKNEELSPYLQESEEKTPNNNMLNNVFSNHGSEVLPIVNLMNIGDRYIEHGCTTCICDGYWWDQCERAHGQWKFSRFVKVDDLLRNMKQLIFSK